MGQAKVNNIQPLQWSVDNDVGRLEIHMHNTMSVEESKPFYNLAEEIVALRGLLPSRKNATFSINDLSGLSSRGCSTICSRQIGQQHPALMRQSSQNECMHPVRLTNFWLQVLKFNHDQNLTTLDATWRLGIARIQCLSVSGKIKFPSICYKTLFFPIAHSQKFPLLL